MQAGSEPRKICFYIGAALSVRQDYILQSTPPPPLSACSTKMYISVRAGCHTTDISIICKIFAQTPLTGTMITFSGPVGAPPPLPTYLYVIHSACYGQVNAENDDENQQAYQEEEPVLSSKLHTWRQEKIVQLAGELEMICPGKCISYKNQISKYVGYFCYIFEPRIINFQTHQTYASSMRERLFVWRTLSYKVFGHLM